MVKNTPNERIVNSFSIGGDTMKGLLILVLKWILNRFLKKRNQSKEIEISITIKIHKD